MIEALKNCKAKISGPNTEVIVGNTDTALVAIGAQQAMPFVPMDGPIPNNCKIAVEIHDQLPEGYPSTLKKAWGDCINSAQEWANKASELGADLIALRISSFASQEPDLESFIELAKAINKDTKKPLIILGINNRDIDKKYLPLIAQKLSGLNVLIGPVEEDTYKDIIPACIESGHAVIARTPIDVNLAKQLNILITDLGVDKTKIIMDPNMGGLGYGLDYAYSVVEKIRLAAFSGDTMLNMPIVVFSGEEAWRTKEAKSEITDEETGNLEDRAAIWEILSTTSMIMAGADLAIMAYPSSIVKVRTFLRGV